ncbi:flap endonuclease-1 [Candidatus Woesearchaeota archaeon]|nr:flap endonuclease-1 [Candidatus Woesearchaeota archaeon]
MGTNLTPILKSKEISLEKLKNKRLIIDAYNTLYQYLSSIRQRDGTLLMNSKGNVTSHLSGLYFRTINMMKKGMKIAFCFDGESPELKKEEKKKRKKRKEKAKEKYEKAKAEHDIFAMRKYAARTSKLTYQMVAESKELISAMGLPVVQAPSEAEAQAAYMVSRGEFFGIITQDTDALLFGSTRIVKNLTISRKRKKRNAMGYETINPEIIELSENLNQLGLDQDQLIVLSMLVGTDFNPGGIKGIGPKTGLKLLKKYNKDFEKIFKESEWDKFFEYSWKKVFDLIKNMPVTDDYSLEWKNIDKQKIIEILIKKNEFSEKRVLNQIKKLVKKQKQKGLNEWF